MKSIPRLAVALGIMTLVSTAMAADPTGVWKSTVTLNGQSYESTLRFLSDSEAHVLTGSVDDSFGRRNPIPLTKATWNGTKIHFLVEHDLSGEKVSVNYNGTITSDSITGKATFEFGDRSQLAEWSAKRQRSTAAASR